MQCKGKLVTWLSTMIMFSVLNLNVIDGSVLLFETSLSRVLWLGLCREATEPYALVVFGSAVRCL